ncbi:MAG: BON domain-containing protein [Isosphaeraceae bacterium]
MKAYRQTRRTEDEPGPEVIRRARDLLTHSAYSELRGVTSSYHRGVLMRKGRVRSRDIKQVARELTGRIQGVHSVVNEIEVHAPSEGRREDKGVKTAIPVHPTTPADAGGEDSSEKGWQP